MHVQMRDGLAGTLIAIDDKAIAIRDAEFLRELGGDDVEMAEHIPVFWADITMRPDDLARDDQHVDGCLWIDVAERQALIILVHNVRRNLALNDLQKQVILHHGVKR